MKTFFYSVLLALATLIIFGTIAQGCAKSGDGNSAASDNEPEFTVTGEAI